PPPPHRKTHPRRGLLAHHPHGQLDAIPHRRPTLHPLPIQPRPQTPRPPPTPPSRIRTRPVEPREAIESLTALLVPPPVLRGRVGRGPYFLRPPTRERIGRGF